jgi:hypothetical protein
MNYFDPKHPHEPEIPPHFDEDGRCLICVMICERDNAIRKRNEARQQNAKLRDTQYHLRAKLNELINALEGMIKANGGVAVMPTAEAKEQNFALKKAQAVIANIKKRS